ncbi:membrane fusion protein (multidrug efflux system) [Stella humosa]|uniref:Membrane fusion protein (Multidrug efflux system) n=1 Tax=Stella humosa TaxID=94 RepID=A0A3N1LY46_9PROT|nr:efflux RND transporter periplasmic adaptor subunit [Stella humosa]ROQ00134.1 membrane fusion protein (multidrug efflux system) [Stella humosa]BBK30632.1 MexH family multidrug efflux RND transporter periplasmic adaptor subunit [Stella humosa]
MTVIRRLGYLAILVALAAGAVFAVSHFRDGASRLAAAGRDGARPPVRAIAVETAAVTVGRVTDDINVVGSLQPAESVVIQPEIPGRIVRFGFADGARVKKGDLLVELDPALLKGELAKARSDLTLARTNNERANQLASQGTGTLRARDEALAVLQAAQANFDLAQTRLDRAEIRAPFAGTVGLRMFSVGAYVSPGDRIVELASTDPVRVDFRVSEVFLTSIRTGQRIAVLADALPGRTFAGEIYALHPIVDENGRALRLRASLPNPDGALHPGLFVRIRVVVEERPNAVLAPESAVFPVDQKKYVYRVDNGRAVLTEVQLGRRQPGLVEIASGLTADAVVVTAGQPQLRDGAAVEVVGREVVGREKVGQPAARGG